MSIKTIFVFVVFIVFECNLLLGQTITMQKGDLTYAFIEAMQYKEFGKPELAAQTLMKCIKRDSTCAACYFELSKLYYQFGDKYSAMVYAQKATSIDNYNYWYLRLLLEMQRLNENYTAADTTYNFIVKRGFKNLDDDYNHALVLLSLKNGKEAFKILDRIEKENGISEMISLTRYKYFLISGKEKKAIEELKKLIVAFPDNVQYYGMIAELYAVIKDDKNALLNYNILLQAEPKNISANISYARYFINKKDTTFARKRFNLIFNDTLFSDSAKIVALNEFSQESPNTWANKVYMKTEIVKLQSSYKTNIDMSEAIVDYYEKTNNYNEARNVLNSLIKLDSSNVKYWEKYYYYSNSLKDYNSILLISDSVSKVYPNNPTLCLLSAIASFESLNYVKTISILKRGLEIDGINNFFEEQAILFLTESYIKIQNTDSAYYYFEKALNDKVKSIVLLNNYAYYLSENNDLLEKAKKMASIVISNEPNNPTYLDTYAWVFYKLKDYSNAYKYIKLAYKNGGNTNPDVNEHFGDISFCFGKKNEAIKYWKQAIKLGSDSNLLENKINNFKCK
jgi:tetratricopeptide (TPR) repeat protein